MSESVLVSTPRLGATTTGGQVGIERFVPTRDLVGVLPPGWQHEAELVAGAADGSDSVHVVADPNGRRSVLKLFASGSCNFTEEVRARMVIPRHPNILPLWDSGIADTGEPFVLMPYEEKGTLRQRLETDGPFECDAALTLALGLVSAVVTAHEYDVVHGDIKPANVLIGFGDQLILTDFSAACSTDEPRLRPATSANIAAPELLQGGGNTTASDVYALGVTLRHLVLGLSEHDTETETSAIEVLAPAITIGKAKGYTRRPLLAASDQWLALTDRMMAPEPDRRPSAIEVLEELCAMNQGSSTTSGAVLSCDVAQSLRRQTGESAGTRSTVAPTELQSMLRLLYLLSAVTLLTLVLATVAVFA